MEFLLESTASTASRVSTTRIENKKLCNVLLKWLQTLHLKSPHRTLYEITDGVALAEALNQIAPECFDDNWFSKIKKDVGSNWRLKVSNLKKIVEKIHDFYQDCDPQHMGNFVKPDVIKIGDQDDTMELARLLQLILGCAVNCRNAQNYITNIRSMDENSQTVIMQSIQDLERVQGHPQNSITTNSIGVDIDNQDQIRQLIEELESVTKTRDQMTQRCLELDSQISLLQEEKTYILEEKRHLEERLLESVEDPLKGSGQRRQIEDLKEELYKAETSRDDLRMKLETQEREMAELKTKFELLQETAGEARLLKDELDILRDTADRVEKYESTILSYKKKLEELGDLKRQIKILETKNIAYIQQNMELEQEVKKASVWKSQLELYKKQVTELHNTLNNETNKIDKLEFETKKLSENLNALQKEKDRLVIERDSLKEANEELKCCQAQIKNISSVEHSQTTEDMESAMDLKQKLVRLQHENNMLKMNQKDPDEDKISVLQTLLDNTRQQYNELRLDNRKSNQKILELESELKERSDEMNSEWRSKIKELQSQLQCEKDTRSMDLEEKNSAISDKDQLINMLQVSLHQKDLEIQEWEEKYKKNVKKAKSVVKCMDSKNIALSDVDTSVLENRLIKANKELNDLKREQESNKILLDTEEKLMSSAFYRLAQSKMQEAVDQRVMNQGLLHSQTFLSKHRQQTNKSVELPIISK